MGVSKAVAPDVLRKVAGLRRALAKAEAPEEALNVGAGAAGIEEMMRKSGLYRTAEIRPVRELYLDSRWTLGRMLRKVMRGTAGRPKKGNKDRADPNFGDELARLNLNKARAIEAQRIGTLPEPEKTKTYREAETQDVLPTIELLIDVARPYWFQASRKDKHRNIADKARNDQAPDSFGPFPLIYADPPWKFDVYSEKGLDRTPDQHYPTLSDEEIIALEIYGKRMDEVASADAALLLWCTSSNIERALAVMSGWGFTYKTQAVWVKDRTGLGLVFRNKHEVLLYGTRGAMPGPQYQPSSVFEFPRGRHSAKPPEIRTEIEKMYPDFDEQTRLELFSRDSVPGWTHFGFEAKAEAAE
jgi:N6-adenosine-specific RNA methylase IME4